MTLRRLKTRLRTASTVAVVSVLCVIIAACGVAFRAPSVPQAPTVTPAAPTDPYVKPRAAPVFPPVSSQPLALEPGQTVVTVTFDDGLASAAKAASIMAEHSLAGTFFVNSGTIGMSGHLSLPDLDTMAMQGHEIGGHTVTHPDLEELTADEARRQICDDRATLLGWGFSVRNFAFPFAAGSPEMEDEVRECGYNSARSLGELRTSRSKVGVPPELSCQLCDVTETVPPADPEYTRAPAEVDSDWTISDLEHQVSDAIAVGGWLQLTFHGLCPTDCSQITTPQAVFEEFIAWLATQQAAGSVLVRTVGDVIGGPVQPPVTGPVVPPAPPQTNEVVNPGLEEHTDGIPSCWMQAGFGENSADFSLVPTAHSRATASRVIVRDYVNGDAKLQQSTDLGTCAPAVLPGRTYTIQAWYTSTVPTSFSVQYRLARGVWVYGVSSPSFAAASEFTLARWTLPAIPAGVTAISFGLGLAQDGELITDDYSLIDEANGPP
jgi:peptidoglycan/xylan/chitin deacetylase (PgdA/CDA1 family)